MNGQPSSDPFPQADREKYWVALSSLLAAVLLTSLKLAVGLATNSLGVLSEAAHSGLDLVAAGITLWAVWISGRPADREHTYGHGKFENLSALSETLLLLATCVWIVSEAIARLFFRAEVHVDPSIWAFLVIIISIVVDVSRSRALKRTSEKYQSQALEADALHFSTDVWSSGVVLLGLCGVLASEQFGIPWLAATDAVAALLVAMIVVWVSLKLGRKSIDDLLDAIPPELRQKVVDAAGGVQGVRRIVQLRLRRSGPQVFADLTVAVGRESGFEQAHEVADRVEDAVCSVLPDADVVVHVEPVDSGEEDIPTTIRVLAARFGVSAHAIRWYEDDGRRSLELHVEVDDSLSLDEAHRQTTEFEHALSESIPDVNRIVTHIEPVRSTVSAQESQPAGELQIRMALDEFLTDYPHAAQPHELQVQRIDDELTVSLHCTLDAAIAITDAHDFTVRLEEFLRSRVPKLGRVVIHVEPTEQ